MKWQIQKCTAARNPVFWKAVHCFVRTTALISAGSGVVCVASKSVTLVCGQSKQNSLKAHICLKAHASRTFLLIALFIVVNEYCVQIHVTPWSLAGSIYTNVHVVNAFLSGHISPSFTFLVLFFRCKFLPSILKSLLILVIRVLLLRSRFVFCILKKTVVNWNGDNWRKRDNKHFRFKVRLRLLSELYGCTHT